MSDTSTTDVAIINFTYHRFDYEDAMLRINGMQGHVQYLQGISGTENVIIPAKAQLPTARMLADRYITNSNEVIAIMPPKPFNQDDDCYDHT